MKFKTQSSSENPNGRHSFLFTLVIGITCLLLTSVAGIAREYPAAPTVTTYLFVTANDSHRVAVVDPTTLSVIQYVDTGSDPDSQPVRIAMRPDGLKAFVSNTGDDTVSVINTQTFAQTKISVGNEPQELAVSPNGQRVYIVHSGDDRVWVLNATTGATVGTINVGGGSTGGCKDVLVSSDSATVYVANRGLNEVDVINASNGHFTRIATMADGPRRLALCPPPHNNLLFCSDYEGNAVSIINTSTNTLVKTLYQTDGIGVNPREFAFKTDGSETYVTNVSLNSPPGSVSVIDNSTLTAHPTPIPVNNAPWQIIVPPPPNDQYAYVSNGNSDTVTVINTMNDQVYKTLNSTSDHIGHGPFFSVVNPEGTELFISNSKEEEGDVGGGTVSVVDLLTQTGTSQITGIGGKPFDLMFNTQ
jgi:YVTN family beta-propeller protein